MNLALASILLQVFVWIAIGVWKVFTGGTNVGASQRDLQNLKDDVDELRVGMVTNNELHNSNFHEFYKEFVRLRIKVASWTGDSNGHDN